jgi:hypothetical protein
VTQRRQQGVRTVMQLVPLLCKVHLAERGPCPPPAKRLVEMQHGDVGEVGHSRDLLQHPEPLDGAALVHKVQNPAEQVIGAFDEPWRVRRLCGEPLFLNPGNSIRVQREIGQLQPHLRTTQGGCTLVQHSLQHHAAMAAMCAVMSLLLTPSSRTNAQPALFLRVCCANSEALIAPGSSRTRAQRAAGHHIC